MARIKLPSPQSHLRLRGWGRRGYKAIPGGTRDSLTSSCRPLGSIFLSFQISYSVTIEFLTAREVLVPAEYREASSHRLFLVDRGRLQGGVRKPSLDRSKNGKGPRRVQSALEVTCFPGPRSLEGKI